MSPSFLGSVLESVEDAADSVSEFLGPHHVLFPTSRRDVFTAMEAIQGRKWFVRSGRQVTAGDRVDGTGSVVLDLEALSAVKAGAGEVLTEVAATVQEVAETLAAEGLALPLPDSPERSIAGSVLSEGSSLLTRTLGPLQSYVKSVRGVTADGRALVRRDGGRGGAAVIDRARRVGGVLTDLALRAVDASSLWLFRRTFAYTGREDFSKVARSIFLGDDTLPDGMDLAIDGFTGPYGIPLVTLAVAGQKAGHKELANSILERAMDHVPKDCQADLSRFESLGAEVLTDLAKGVRSAMSNPGTETEKFGFLADSAGDWTDLVERFSRDVEKGLSDPSELKLCSRLQLNHRNQLEVSGFAITPALAISPARSFVEALASPAALSPPMPLTRPTGSIPDFDGDVFVESDGQKYRDAKEQYASSSYPEDRTHPFMVAYPKSPSDVGAAILFAKERGKRIVARSGGHQYSGKSSGGQDTIVLSMDHFKTLDAAAEPVVVGPGVRLRDLAREFAKEGVTIPHGECPLVAIGGHAQTGGYGHIARAFGLAMDYVESFDIVSGDGSLKAVERPRAGTTSDNDELFRSVLSGNAGSFGIVTQYRFNVQRDDSQDKSYLYTASRWFKKSLFQQFLGLAQEWTRRLENGDLPDGIDFMMTVRSRDRVVIPPVVLVELVGQPGISNDAKALLEDVVRVSKNGFRLTHEEDHKPLSKISQGFVRSGLEITRDGREFKEPYKKRVNCTFEALNDAFVRGFADLVGEVIDGWPGVKLIFQMLIGGGEAQRKGATGQTGLPHRNMVFKFVFDLFYKSGSEATAEQFQQRMQGLIDQHFNHGQERRVFWGSFGTTDMSTSAVQKMYYDTPAQYAELQRIKRKVDPDNVFRTDFTVQP